MIKEYAFGINKRHHFHDANKYGEFMNSNSDTFCSLYDYDNSVIDFYAKNKTLSLTKELRATQSIVHAMSLQDDVKYRNYVDLKRLDGLINMNRRVNT